MRTYELPSLSALRAFESAARLASFKAAATELFVTPTAISHQLRQLEDYLGVRVLNRSPRSVTLTPEGQELYAAAASSFRDISRVTARLKVARARAVTLSATTAFIGQWLMPRLDELRHLLPDMELRLHASNAVMDLRPGEIDIAIRYGKGPSPGVEAILLRRDSFAPVCSPKLNVKKLGDLKRASLIHVDGRTAPRPPPDWPRWCGHTHVEGVNTEAGLRFTDSTHAVQAAIAGQGIAIASVVLVADALESGLLTRPFEQTLRGDSYYFACASNIGTRADVVVLRDWFRRNLGHC